MLHPRTGHPQNGTQEWLSALFTLLVLVGIYNSMDAFSSGDTPKEIQDTEKMTKVSSASPPYWNDELRYGFRSVAGDTFSASGSGLIETVTIKTGDDDDRLKVSYYKDTPIETIDTILDPKSPRVYSRLAGGIAVLEGNIDSPSAKTIYSTLHSD